VAGWHIAPPNSVENRSFANAHCAASRGPTKVVTFCRTFRRTWIDSHREPQPRKSDSQLASLLHCIRGVAPVKIFAVVGFAVISELATVSAASAQEAKPPSDPQAAALVERLLVALNAQNTFDENAKQMAVAQIQAQPEMAMYADVFTEFYEKFLSYRAVREELVRNYVERFSVQELTELVGFYESDVGRKSTNFVPQIATQVLQAGAIQAQANTPLLQEMINEKSEMLNME
jgi:hypothetical protein